LLRECQTQEKNPAGGVQHIAYSTPVANLDKVISGLKDKRYPVIATYNTPIAKIIFVDSYKDVGVVTEIMGITEEGEKVVQKMKS
jgi:methylmalonyl-CoA/ethylmalonyl-CoA epimerase